MRIRNTALKVAIIEAHTTGRALAKKLRISESRFSAYVSGREDPTPDEQKVIARELKCKVSDIFPTVAA